MTCDDISGAMATGGLLGRWRARRHVARCPRCAAVVRDFENLVGELSAVPGLTPAERRLWLQASDHVPLVSRARPRSFRPAFAGAMATLLLLVPESG